MPSNLLLRVAEISQAVPKPLEEGSSQPHYISFVSKGKKKTKNLLWGFTLLSGGAVWCAYG